MSSSRKGTVGYRQWNITFCFGLFCRWWFEVLCCDAVTFGCPCAECISSISETYICLSPMCSLPTKTSHPVPSYNQYISCIHLKTYRPLHTCTKEFKHRELIQEIRRSISLLEISSPRFCWWFVNHNLPGPCILQNRYLSSTPCFTAVEITSRWKIVVLSSSTRQNSNIKSKIPYQTTTFPFTNPLNHQNYANDILKQMKHKSKSIV